MGFYPVPFAHQPALFTTTGIALIEKQAPIFIRAKCRTDIRLHDASVLELPFAYTLHGRIVRLSQCNLSCGRCGARFPLRLITQP